MTLSSTRNFVIWNSRIRILTFTLRARGLRRKIHGLAAAAASTTGATGAVRAVLANPGLRRIEAAWALGIAGDAAFTVALLVAAFAIGGPAAVGVLTVVRMAPSVVGAPLAGLLARRRQPADLLLRAHGVRALGALAGLQRVGILIGRVPPGKESFVYHSHRHEEEFLYVLAGRGIAEIGEEEVEVEPGDFMGFATPSFAHHLRNPFDVDLVYLMGGEHREVEVADFPRLRKRLIRDGNDLQVIAWDDLGSFWK